jgi:hypothetical protein
VLVTAPDYAPPAEAAFAAAGLSDVEVLPLGCDDRAAQQTAEYLSRLQPAAVISIETLAPNTVGTAHTASGLPASGERPRVETLIAAARDRGVLTIGMGDNGNEAGCGVIEPAVREHKPYGDVCRCPCGGGIATAVSTDVLVVANISNWAAYGVEAMLAASLGDPELLHDVLVEKEMLEAAVDAGAIDGSTGRPLIAVDGTDLGVQQAVLTILRSIVDNGLSQPPGRPF